MNMFFRHGISRSEAIRGAIIELLINSGNDYFTLTLNNNDSLDSIIIGSTKRY